MQWTLVGDSITDAAQAKAMLDGLLSYSKPAKLMTEAETIAACNTCLPASPFIETPRMEIQLPVGSTRGEMDTSIPAGKTVPAEPPAMDDVRENPDAHTYTPGELEFTKEQIKQAATLNAELAKLASKRGKKTAEEQARINELTRAVLLNLVISDTPAEPIGNALKGATAEELAAALGAVSKVVVSEPGVEVRVMVDEMPSFLSTDTAFSDLAALSAAASQQQIPPVVSPPADAPAELTNDALYQKISDYANNGAGLGWYKNVVDQGGGNINKMPREHMLKVLANPEAFYPAAPGEVASLAQTFSQ